ncbi:hypothetical protein PIB30_036084 [Stylosanthes scabra]|uniref:Uncharacterized protein n=1 Tax=Stylosanthes scabra TaxID=79078 RepID=A0ABU6SE51_9FABA|nr:hypothetical protein [Stylosanthes scabra]
MKVNVVDIEVEHVEASHSVWMVVHKVEMVLDLMSLENNDVRLVSVDKGMTVQMKVHKDDSDPRVVDMKVVVQIAHKGSDKVGMDLNPNEVLVDGRVWFESIVVKNVEGGDHMDMVMEEVHIHDRYHNIYLVGMHHRVGYIHSKVEGIDPRKKVVAHTYKAPPSLDSPSLDAHYHRSHNHLQHCHNHKTQNHQGNYP